MSDTRKRWLRVAFGAAMMLCLGTLYAWSIFRAPFGAAYPGWNVSDLSLNFTISMVSFCVGGLLGGRISRRTSGTVAVLTAAVLIFAGFFGVSLLPTNAETAKWMLYLFYGVFSGLGTGVGYNAILAGVAGWFPDKNGRVTGILLAGFGLGSMLVGQLADRLIPVLGLAVVFRIFAVAILAVLAAGARFVRLPEVGEEPSRTGAEEQRDCTPGEMVRHPSFWIFFAWNLLMCSSGLLVINSAASIATYYGVAAVLGLLVSVINGASRMPYGMLVDRFGWKKIMLLGSGLLVLCGALLTAGGMARSAALVLPGVLVMGLCYGNSTTIGTLVIRKFYGKAHYAANLSLLNCCAVLASFTGPMISSTLLERFGGDYTATFLMVLIFGAVSFVVALFVRKP